MKKLLCITMTLALLCGLFTVTSKAENIEPEDTTITETVETTLEVEPEETIDEEEISGETIEADEEIIEDNEEIIEEEEIVEDDSLDDLSFMLEHVGEDDTFEYCVTYDEKFNPNGGFCLECICKHCHYGITEEITREEIKNRFGVDIDERIK